jgi:oligopeptide/dipeptide ABC transporter, ATP-binding protein, C-terminal domain
MSEILLRVKDLSIGVKSIDDVDIAVDGISFNIKKGEILGIVGESGCGKSLTTLSIAGLLPKSTTISAGSIIFDGIELKDINRNEMRKIQGKDISMVFQEPMTSLNPLMTIGKQVSEGLKIHFKLTNKEIKERVLAVLSKVGLTRCEEIYNSYPHQLSGGMRQRVMIAIAIICKPKLIIADEPTTALDVTIQSQILGLLKHINEEYKTSILFISHDLGVISKLCHRVAVMYSGNIVEEGTIKNIFINPVHQYTKGLIESIPTREKKGTRLSNIEGKVPAIKEKKFGCSFAPRCQKAEEKCFYEKPKSVNLGPNHRVCCNLAELESGEEYVI